MSKIVLVIFILSRLEASPTINLIAKISDEEKPDYYFEVDTIIDKSQRKDSGSIPIVYSDDLKCKSENCAEYLNEGVPLLGVRVTLFSHKHYVEKHFQTLEYKFNKSPKLDIDFSTYCFEGNNFKLKSHKFLKTTEGLILNYEIRCRQLPENWSKVDKRSQISADLSSTEKASQYTLEEFIDIVELIKNDEIFIEDKDKIENDIKSRITEYNSGSLNFRQNKPKIKKQEAGNSNPLKNKEDNSDSEDRITIRTEKIANNLQEDIQSLGGNNEFSNDVMEQILKSKKDTKNKKKEFQLDSKISCSKNPEEVETGSEDEDSYLTDEDDTVTINSRDSVYYSENEYSPEEEKPSQSYTGHWDDITPEEYQLIYGSSQYEKILI